MTTKIKEIPKEERPRERLIRYGVEKLSNEELLTILLKTGTKSESAKDLATTILSRLKDIHDLDNINYNILSKIKGVGEAKACTIITAVELGKRIKKEVNSLNSIKIVNSDIVFKYFNSIFYNKKQEFFYCIYLDNKKRVIETKLLFIGTINQSLVHPREVYKEAILLSASAIICIHNHPSGVVDPSREDIELTQRLVDIGYLIGIKVVDHLIIGSNNYFSFADEGMI